MQQSKTASAYRPQLAASSNRAKRHRAGAPSPTIPPLRFRRADRIAACKSIACFVWPEGLGYQGFGYLRRRHGSRK